MGKDGRNLIQFTMGYVGYFLMGFIALKTLFVYDDKAGFIILVVGLLLLVTYMQFLEKKRGSPKYSGYIKLILFIGFSISAFTLI